VNDPRKHIYEQTQTETFFVGFRDVLSWIELKSIKVRNF